MAVAQLPSLYVQSATKISIQSSKTFNQSPFAAMSSTSSGQSLLYSHIVVISSQLVTSIDYYSRTIFNLMCFFDKPSLQQCIEYCSNAKKKRCPVCKQAFSEANIIGNLYQKLIDCEDNPGELQVATIRTRDQSCCLLINVNFAETPVSKVMTRNPVFVLSDTLAIEALQTMVLGKFRHLPIVESGEVIALLDIAKCLYDAIARMERAAEKGKAIAVAVEGPNTFIETLRDRMFRLFLSTIIPESSKIATVLPTDTVLMAIKKMVEYGMSSAVVAVENKTRGILTSKDILMKVIAQNLPPESTPVEKVMTPNLECATVDTPIVDALHIMHDGKFLHLPVVDKDGVAVAIVDVLHITYAAIATVSPLSFWDHQLSCMSLRYKT
ncbi:hypothetical protein ACSBR1_025369 [Camellia fascicularis]